MTNNATYMDHKYLSLCPAPGWRAAYIHGPNEGEPGWSADPLVAFVICNVVRRPCHGSTAPTYEEGHEVHGLVYSDYLHCAEVVSNFWRYLPPGEPDPTSEEVAAKQDEEARSKSRRRQTS